jgi:hypothetical protein
MNPLVQVLPPPQGVLTGWTALQESPWAYPALEVVHLLGVALLLGNLVTFELRLLGLGRRIDRTALAKLALPLAVLGFVLAAASGLTMFATQPGELLANDAFRLKMLLLLLAGGNAVVFHARGSLARHDAVARVQGGVSLLLWVSVLGCGRAIGYL